MSESEVAAVGLFQLGLERSRMGDMPGALTAFTSSAGLVPTASAYNNIGSILMRAGRNEEADAAFRRAIALNPNDVRALTNLALANRSASRLLQAQQIIQRARAIAPMDADVLEVAAGIARDLGKADDAISLYRQALARDRHHMVARANLADLFRALGRVEEATEVLIVLLDEAAAADRPSSNDHQPNSQVINSLAMNGLLMSLVDIGRVEEAEEIGRRLLLLKDNLAVSGFLHALSRFSLKSDTINQNGQDVISFSLFGDLDVYCQGAIENIQISRHYYPEWVCRFYVDDTVPAAIRERLVADGAQVVIVPEAWQSGRHGALWRYHVTSDPTVRRFLSRDCDNRLNQQEAWAVRDWERSGRLFHAMRDHHYHAELIMGGMWGGHAGVLPPIEDLLGAFPQAPGYRWSDQVFAATAIWPLVRSNILIHDSVWDLFGARRFPKDIMLPRPDHVGRNLPVGSGIVLPPPPPRQEGNPDDSE